jgi:hypothetical protein
MNQPTYEELLKQRDELLADMKKIAALDSLGSAVKHSLLAVQAIAKVSK